MDKKINEYINCWIIWISGWKNKKNILVKKIRVFDYKKIPSKVDFIINVAGPDQD